MFTRAAPRTPTRTLATCIAVCLSVLAGGCGQSEPAPRHVRIHDIQGPEHLSPLRGLSVVDVPGVVTAVHDQGMWLQDIRPDDRADTSEGIYVYLADSPDVAVGDTVSVSGTVSEVRGGDSDGANLTVTQLTRPKVSRTGSAELPEPIRVGSGGARFPQQIHAANSAGGEAVDLERGARFDHGRNAVDAMETLEGMRVAIADSVAVGPSGDQLPVWPASSVPQQLRSDRGGVLAGPDEVRGETVSGEEAVTGRVMLDDTLTALPTADVGDELQGSDGRGGSGGYIQGIWHYAGGNYALLPVATPRLRPGGLTPQTATAPQSYELSIAALHADGLSADADQATVNAYAEVITRNLRRPDIVVVTGVGDDSGKRDDDTVAAANTFGALRAAVNSGNGPEYDYRQINPADNDDSAVPGTNPRTGFLFRSDRARFVDRPGGGAQDATAVSTELGRAQLDHSPGRIAPDDTAFEQTRKAVAGEFDINGASLFVIGVDSSGSDAAAQTTGERFGRYQPPKDPSRQQRLAQAQTVAAFAGQLGDASETARVVVLGTVRDSPDSSITQAFTATQLLRPAAAALPERQRYSCVDAGLSTLADQAFTSPNVGSVGYQIVHTGAEFADRVTDHDPQLVRIRASAG